MQTKLKNAITSNFVNNKVNTEKNLDFLSNLISLRSQYHRQLPYNPNVFSNTDSRRFDLDPRAKELLDKALEIELEINKLSDMCYTLTDTIRKESGQNELVFLEEITHCFPENFRISTEIENDWRSISFGVIFSIKDFPNSAKLPNIFQERKIYKNDYERLFRGLTNESALGWRDQEALKEDFSIFELAKKENFSLNERLKPLINRGFQAYLTVKNISSKNLVCTFSLK